MSRLGKLEALWPFAWLSIRRSKAAMRKRVRDKATDNIAGPTSADAADDTLVSVPIAADDAAVETSQRAEPGPSHSAQPTPTASLLEALPAELRLQVLYEVADLDDLKALILASPVYCQQYRLDRKRVLSRVLVSAFGSFFVDSHAVQRSATLYSPPRPLSEDRLRDFIRNYASLRLVGPEPTLKDCTLADLLGMAAFHQHVARPLSLECAALFLQQIDPSLEVGHLSGTEQTRLLRALYRFQVYCNLFGQGPKQGGYRAVPPMDPVESLALFFGTLYPWEVEEIDCVYKLIRNKYVAIPGALQCDVDSDGSDMDQDAIDADFDRRRLREGTALRGLGLFLKVLRVATQGHEELVKTVREYQVRHGIFEHVLSWGMQQRRRAAYPSALDLAGTSRGPHWRRRRKLGFVGDTVDGPPLAWVITWRRKYLNVYGPRIPDTLKEVGYVFWDRGRLIDNKSILGAVLRARDEWHR